LFDCSFKIFGSFLCKICLNTAISNPFCLNFTYFASILLIAFADLFFQFFAGKIGAPLNTTTARTVLFRKRLKSQILVCW